MTAEDDKKPGSASADHHHHHHPQQYGTFQGVANYAPPPVGFPQPVPPPGAAGQPSADYYARGYQGVPVEGYAIAEGTPVVRERRLPCCGIGLGWFLFIIGFFLAGIPWYAGALIIICSRVDHREKPGYVACSVGAIVFTIALVLGVTKEADDW